MLHAKSGAADELAAAIARHWAAVRELNLVEESPHVTMRGAEGGNRTYFVEVFTWRDATIPDHAPARVTVILVWNSSP